MARGSGVKHDVRLLQTNSYADYQNVPVKSFYGVNGDCYDRFLIRMLEMGESLRIMSFCLKHLQPNKKMNIYSPLVFKKHTESAKSYTSMQDLINHFIE
jgi:NADH-quinone oxidoreductase subunit D